MFHVSCEEKSELDHSAQFNYFEFLRRSRRQGSHCIHSASSTRCLVKRVRIGKLRMYVKGSGIQTQQMQTPTLLKKKSMFISTVTQSTGMSYVWARCVFQIWAVFHFIVCARSVCLFFHLWPISDDKKNFIVIVYDTNQRIYISISILSEILDIIFYTSASDCRKISLYKQLNQAARKSSITLAH